MVTGSSSNRRRSCGSVANRPIRFSTCRCDMSRLYCVEHARALPSDATALFARNPLAEQDLADRREQVGPAEHG